MTYAYLCQQFKVQTNIERKIKVHFYLLIELTINLN